MRSTGSAGTRHAGQLETSRRATKATVPFVVRSPSNAERETALRALDRQWGMTVVTRGTVHTPASLPMLVAVDDGMIRGALTYRPVTNDESEPVTLDAFVGGRDIGSARITAALGLRPTLWLVRPTATSPRRRFIAGSATISWRCNAARFRRL